MVVEAARHQRARNLFSGLTKVTLPTVVIYELVWALSRLGVKPRATSDALEALIQNRKVAASADDGDFSPKAIRRVVEEKTNLSNFDDKVVLETALKAGVPLVAFDRELDREWRRATGEARRGQRPATRMSIRS